MTELGEILRSRLREYARLVGANTEFVLTRWATERFLARLSSSRFRDRFALKGGLLFSVWDGDLFRSTLDLDLCGLRANDRVRMVDIISEIASLTPSVADGVDYRMPDGALIGLHGTEIPGVRILLDARIGTAVVRIKVDTAFGQPITPGVERRWFPSLLAPFVPSAILCYPRETVVAEKLAAAVEFGADNTRLRDYYDLWYLSQRLWFQGHMLVTAVEATFGQRDAGRFLLRTDGYWQAAFSPAFATPAKQRSWKNWVVSHAPDTAPPELCEVVEEVGRFGVPVLDAVRKGRRSPGRWSPAQSWSSLASRRGALSAARITRPARAGGGTSSLCQR